ncbi:condensation domain-containing protein [Streptomyces abyssomicinicus]|uniref:condensation domain-containing protein n=1 Tax=Streptomyces abyssomicinicus TaxID=574929 RepID=UPI001250857A|nr:condensation domain-containing protein [Streptomyces abyssomicinicus]
MSQLSPAQHGMWIAARQGAGTAYHMPVVIRLSSPPDHDVLAKACHALVERHPALAGAVAERDGVPHLVAAAEPPALRRAASVDEVVTRPFDLAAGPLSRFALVGSDTLVCVAHHLVLDGGSKDVLVAGLGTLIGGGALGGPRPADADHGAGRTSGERTSAVTAEATRFWAGRPHRAEATVVAGEVLRSRSTADGALLEFSLDIPRLDGLSRFEVLTAALHALLASYGNPEVVTALDLSTRPEGRDSEIGCWVNELPLSSRPSAGAPFRGFAEQLRAELREMYAYRDVPLARAVPGLRPHAALAPVSLSYRRLAAERPALGEVEWLAFNHGVRGALQLQVVQATDGARVSLRHDPRELTVPGRFADDLTGLLAAVAIAPDRPLGDLLPFASAPPTAGAPAAPTAAPVTEAPAEAAADATPAPADAVAAVPATSGSPDDPLVAQVREIWETVLDCAPIAPDDDIFDLGGHSLTITQIISRMEQRLGVEISLDDFFDNPTIAGVVAVVRG